MQEAATGASLTIPSGWRAAVGEAPLLPLFVGSDTLPGLAVVLMTSGLTVDALARVLAEPIELDEATVLQQQGPPQQQGDRVSVRYAGGGGIVACVARTAGGAGVVMLYVGGAGQESTGLTLLEALAASASFEQGSGATALARVRQDWTGYRIWTYYFGGASCGTTSAYRLSWTSSGQYQLDGSDIERRAVGPC